MARLTREQKDTEQNQIKRQDISHETKDTPQRGADHITEFTRAPRHGRDSQKSSDRDCDNRPDFIHDTLVSLLFGLNLLRLRLRFGRRRAGIVFCCFILGAGRPAGPAFTLSHTSSSLCLGCPFYFSAKAAALRGCLQHRRENTVQNDKQTKHPYVI